MVEAAATTGLGSPNSCKTFLTIGGIFPWRRGWTKRIRGELLRAGEDGVVIGSVSLPVKVFCWLGWKLPSRVQRPSSASVPWPKRGLGRGVGTPIARAARRKPSQPKEPSAITTRT